jgi:hypothetical protein
MHEHPLASLDVGRTVKELVSRRPAQDHSGRLCRVNACRHTSQVVGPKGAVRSIRPEYGHVRHAIPDLKPAYAFTELIDFANDIIAERERRSAAHGLRVDVAPDRYVGVFQA